MAADSIERPAYRRPLSEAPASLVSDGLFRLGCYNGLVEYTNMLDASRPYHYALPRWFKRSRCKQWRAFQAGDQRWFVFSALYEARLFGLSLFYLWDRQEGRSYQIRGFRPLSGFGIGDRPAQESIGYQTRHSAINYRNDFPGGQVQLEASSVATAGQASILASLNFSLNPRQTAPSSVCLPLGMNRAMYSAKVLMPMHGWLEIDGERHELSGPEAMGIMDDHKGYYPYRLRYDWVTGFGRDSRGRRVGFNLTNNQVKDQGRYNENVLWINSRLFALPPVTLTRPQGVEGVWHIQDTEGLIDLSFKPEIHNNLQLNALVAATNYSGPFGSFEGRIRSADGTEKIDARGLVGMGEQKYLRV